MIDKIKLKHLLYILSITGFTVGFVTFLPANLDISNHKVEYIQDKLNDGQLAPKMVIIPPGKGTIGGEILRSFRNEGPIHQVTINTSYALSETEITFAQYDLYCQEKYIECPSDDSWGREQQPVINVSWFNAMSYTEWLTKKTGHTYRLPSEAEWEYAARAGQNSKFWWGNEYQQGLDHCDRDYAGCPKGSDLGHPWRVGILTANPFGLYDMTSNVSEWVLDCGSDNHDNASGTVEANYSGNCNEKINKGVSWQQAQPFVHHSSRMSLPKDYTHNAIGFRVLREINQG